MTSQDGRSLSRGTVGWCVSPITSEGASSFGEVGHLGSLPRRRNLKRGWNQTRQTERTSEPARITATLGAA